MSKDKVFKYIKKKYGADPEYLWTRYPGYAVFRHDDNKKWFALVADIPFEKIDPERDGEVYVINVKIDDPVFMDMLLHQNGYYPAYHMNKKNWITILLDGTVPLKDIYTFIDFSFGATASAKKKEKDRPPKEWVIPANPKFYDIEHAFDNETEIDWKQGNGIKTGDTVFMYVAAPISAIMYKCTVLETDIPYAYQDKNLTITALMKIRLEKRYDRKQFTFDILKEEYGIYAIRGPRGIPDSLSREL
ncbi:MAG: MmcQ/YjbR family DNA-binding protein [Eubacterium sp.]|nr:MmcQ/YjbR family DNA-binding protein [Eubacterium sp.]